MLKDKEIKLTDIVENEPTTPYDTESIQSLKEKLMHEFIHIEAGSVLAEDFCQIICDERGIELQTPDSDAIYKHYEDWAKEYLLQFANNVIKIHEHKL